jgi:hypothetical protein
MKYHYMRLFLLEQERPPLLEATGSLPPTTTRQEYLVQVFSRRIDFKHWNKTLVYVPIGIEDAEGGPIMLGRIGRPIAAVENTPPEDGFEETTHTSWRAANVLIDTRDHPDGQKLAFQYHANVGKPLPIAGSLINHINETNRDSGWLVEVNLITERQSFWDAVTRHRGEITTAEFTFVTPNILGIRSKLNDELKSKRANHNATTVTETLNNPDGNLNLNGQDVEESVDYISEGGGKSKLKVGRSVVYDSDKEEKLVEIEGDEPLTTENKSTWKIITDILF